MQTTLAFAPLPEDLTDIDLDAPLLTAAPPSDPAAPDPDEEESEQGEP